MNEVRQKVNAMWGCFYLIIALSLVLIILSGSLAFSAWAFRYIMGG